MTSPTPFAGTPTFRATTRDATLALARRDLLRFVRQPARLAGTLGQPLLFWLVLGAGLSPSFDAGTFAGGGMTYTEYFYPGMLAMMVLFASVFSTITLIEDRDQGFLQGVMAAPVSRLSIVMGKVLGGTMVAMIQASILLLAIPFMGFHIGPGSVVMIVVTLAVLSVACTGFGFLVAWSMESTAGFHGVMMLVMMPLWFLSSALFPLESAPAILKGVMYVNPFTWAMILLRAPFYGGPLECFADTRYLTALGITAGVVLLILWGGVRRVKRREKGLPLARG
ncbi:ABC transporter permease [Phaeovibrio sulfidiphilus]|uniref:Transport permease protein n=1 Tax=Phaeovibrio sulfidiphilus TaxID=1220600 RepID=A0A8J7CQK7_9PROT|nr:ABC transporter permease [Phaeovibrio sulfidiphilus]MBE1236930.1 ABC transporter permease [Phaeovibrio sulfidiphilus]